MRDGNRGWILYDDSCGVCRRFVPFWEGTLSRRGFEFVPLQSDWVRANLNVGESELTDDLRLLLSDGSQIRGADAYRFAMKRIWWTYPLYLLAAAPVIRIMFDRGYRTFARHRYQISRLCGLPGAG
jgi:predicted DCC family thiol-disulfide oxidoreductase YuxK